MLSLKIRPLVNYTTIALLIAADVFLARVSASLLPFYLAYMIAVVVWFVAFLRLDIRLGLDSAPLKNAVSFAITIIITGSLLTTVFVFGAHNLSTDQYQYRDFETFLRAGLAPWSGFVFTYPQGAALLFTVLMRFPPAAWTIVALAAQAATIAIITFAPGRPSRHSLVSGFAYATCPFTLIEAGTNAHLDVLVSLCFAAAGVAILAKRESTTAALLTAAALLKAWPAALVVGFVLGLRKFRSLLYATLAVALVVLLSIFPFAKDLGGLVFYWHTLLPFNGGSTLAGVVTTSTFVQNSLFALRSDWPTFWFLIPVGAFLFCGSFVAFCFRNELSSAAATLTWTISCIFMSIMGIYVASMPFAPSAHAYTWWTPSAVLILRGTAMLLFSIGAIATWPRYFRSITRSSHHLLMSGIAVSIGIIFLHGNTFGWYLLPCLAFFCFLPSGKSRWFLLASLCAFYASYTTSNFRQSPDKIIAKATHYTITTAPDYYRANQQFLFVRKLPSGGYGVSIPKRFRYIAVHMKGLCQGQLSTTIAHRTSFTTVSNNQSIVPIYRSSGREAAIRPPGHDCAISTAYGLTTDANSVRFHETRKGDLRMTLAMRSHHAAFSPYIKAYAPLHVRPTRYMAIAISQWSSMDPSFGGNAVAISGYLIGRTKTSADVRVPFDLNDRNTPKFYHLIMRYPLKNLTQQLAVVTGIEIEARAVIPTVPVHIVISHVAIVDDSIAANGNWIAVVLGVLLLTATFVWGVRFSENEGIPERDDSEGPWGELRRTMASGFRVLTWALRTLLYRLAHLGRLHVASNSYIDVGLVMIGLGKLAINKKSYIGAYCVYQGDGNVNVGTRTYLGHYVNFGSDALIAIGDDCLVGNRVTFIDSDHIIADREEPIRKQGLIANKITISNNVWIGTGVVVLRGVTIGEGAVVGAGAVVTRDVPPYTVVAGVPARPIKRR